MIQPNILYSTILLTAGVCCLIVGGLVLQRRPYPSGAIPLMVFIFAMCWWDISYGVFWAGAPAPTPYFWMDISYIGVVIVPATFFIFTLQLTGKEAWLKKPFLTLLYLEPVLVLVLMWTDPWHGLFFAGKRLENTGMILNAGPVFWGNVVYSYLLLLAGFILLVQRFRNTAGIYRRQIGVILAGAGITWLNSFIFVLGLSPFPNADNTPFSFTIAAFAFAYALLRYRMLDIVPIARDMLIEGMSDGVLVLDANNRIVDMNPEAGKLIPASLAAGALGKPVDEVFAQWAGIIQTLMNVENTRVELAAGTETSTYLDIQISPLRDKKNLFIGRLVIWRDITRLKQVQKDLEKLASQDPLTLVYNRRHFYKQAEMEAERCIRYQSIFSIILVDIDHFKKINDTYGHKAGDEALIHFTNLIQQSLRKADIFARFGGEEFVMLLPEADANQAKLTAERIRKIIESAPLEIEGHRIKITASFGVSTFKNKQDALDLLLQKADKALYTAKKNGRNRVVCVD